MGNIEFTRFTFRPLRFRDRLERNPYEHAQELPFRLDEHLDTNIAWNFVRRRWYWNQDQEQSYKDDQSSITHHVLEVRARVSERSCERQARACCRGLDFSRIEM